MASYRIGRYEIIGEVGKGAMGVVHRARDPVLDRVVALKTMFTGPEVQTEAKERFLREARSVARLQHPNIITVYELGEVEGNLFIAMEYLDGGSLADALQRGGLPTLDHRLAVVLQLCRGLAYAHSRGVVHRDVKPSNVFVLPDGTVKLLDFGIAWLEGGTFATRTGIILGTPSYMAPEQFSGGTVDHRVDMWAAGVILYELLSGFRPFDGDTVPALIYKIVHTPVPALDHEKLRVPRALIEVLERALAKDPQERYPDLESMGMALHEASRGVIGDVPQLADWLQQARPATVDLGLGQATGMAVAAPATPVAAATGGPAWSGAGAGEKLHTGVFREAALIGERAGLQVIAVSPDESVIAVGGVDGSVRIWSLDTRIKLLTLRSRLHLRTGHAALTTVVRYSHDGALMATGHLDGSVYVWDAHKGLEMEARLRHEAAVTGLAFTRDGQTLISGGADSVLKCWELPAVLEGEARRQLRRQPAEVTTFTVSPDTSLIISGHSNRAIRVTDTVSGRLTATLHGHRSPPSSMAMAPDGDLLACGSRDGSIRLFRLSSRAELRCYEAHNKTIASLAFFEDGRHFVSVAMDIITTLWGSPGESFACVRIMQGRRQLVCGMADGRIRIWDYA
jgi:hypothetical protein